MSDFAESMSVNREEVRYYGCYKVIIRIEEGGFEADFDVDDHLRPQDDLESFRKIFIEQIKAVCEQYQEKMPEAEQEAPGDADKPRA